MQVGIDSFAAALDDASLSVSPSERLRRLVEQIEYADKIGLDVFGIGEHHRREFLDSAPAVILAAADSLFAEKLDLLLKIRDNEHVHWSGEYRPTLNGQGVYPRPLQEPLPIWIGVGGTPESFVRAGALGLPLMVAIIGGETRSFRPLIDLYREAGRRAGYLPQQLKVGVHSLGYVAESTQEAVDDFFPGYAHAMTKVGKERGWPKMTRASFDAQRGPQGALLVGDPDEVVEKIIRHSQALGGISRITFMMNPASIPHAKLMRATELIGTRVAPALREELGGKDG